MGHRVGSGSSHRSIRVRVRRLHLAKLAEAPLSAEQHLTQGAYGTFGDMFSSSNHISDPYRTRVVHFDVPASSLRVQADAASNCDINMTLS